MKMEQYKAVAEAWKRCVEAQKASERAAAARGALPPGSSRARVTTANARWARAAEDRDRCEAQALRITFEQFPALARAIGQVSA